MAPDEGKYSIDHTRAPGTMEGFVLVDGSNRPVTEDGKTMVYATAAGAFKASARVSGVGPVGVFDAQKGCVLNPDE